MLSDVTVEKVLNIYLMLFNESRICLWITNTLKTINSVGIKIIRYLIIIDLWKKSEYNSIHENT